MTNKSLRLLSVFLIALAFPSVLNAQTYDGQWAVSESVNATACGEGNIVESYTATVSQNGSVMTVTSSGITRSGTFTAATLTFTASYPEDGGTISSTGTIVFNGNSASGSSNWTWTDGSLSCAGSSSISAIRTSAPAPQPEPEPEPEPDPTPPSTVLPGAPQMNFGTSGNTLSISWNPVTNATGYLLYYAPYPSADPVASLDVGAELGISGDLPTGANFYIALQSYNAAGSGAISEVGIFKIKGVDVIEIANQSSDIAAIVYGQKNASAVLFNDGGTTSTVVFRFADNQSATLVSDSQGNPMQFDIAGHNFVYTYAGGQVRTTLTEPDGTQSTVVEMDLFASALRKPLLLATDSCPLSNRCTDVQAASWDLADEEALEQNINTNGGAMERISGTVLACPFWIPASACESLGGYLVQTENLIDRLTDRVNSKVKRIGTAFKCLTGSSECAAVAAEQAPTAVAEIEQFDSAPSQPTASFNVDADALRPDPDSWATYLAEAGFTMVDVPCAESVFASIRPECGGVGETPESPDSPGASDGGETPPAEPISNCVEDDPTRATGEAGCFNDQGNRTGEWKFYFTGFDNNRFVGRIEVYSNNATTVEITSYGGSGSYIIGQETEVNGKLEGTYSRYYSDGSLREEAEYSAGVRNGAYKLWWEPGAIRAVGAYANGLEDGHWDYYFPPGSSASGNKSLEGSYTAGRRVGVWTNYRSDNGAVLATTTY